jgi:hypothetical protein
MMLLAEHRTESGERRNRASCCSNADEEARGA